jgi:large subunit ribosomal protein L22
MKVLASARNLPISAQKLRLNTTGLRGLSVQSALEQLAALPQKGAGMVFDTVKSASANAQHNFNLKPAILVIDEIRVDQGPQLKRWRPRSKGMTSAIMHPKAHITVILTEKPIKTEPAKSKPSKKAEVK